MANYSLLSNVEKHFQHQSSCLWLFPSIWLHFCAKLKRFRYAAESCLNPHGGCADSGIAYHFQVVQFPDNHHFKTRDSTCDPLSKVSKDNLHRAFKLANRNEIGSYLESFKFTTGAELGVQTGGFSKELLSRWPSAKKFYLVDIWQQQKSYVDSANVANSEQQKYFEATRELLKPWANKTVFLRMFIHEAAKKVDDNSLDFVYVDARHDYCGVKQDLEDFWPKVKIGGIMAGHDYVYAFNDGNQNWGICGDGTYSPLSVKWAVHEFAAKYCVYVKQVGDSWMLFK